MKSTYNFLIIITLMLLSNIVYSQSVPSYVPTNGLVGWWGFNGNAQDGSGNGNHGTVNGATLTTDRFGNQNGAYLFQGNESISTSINGFPIGNAPRTISVWGFPTNIDGQFRMIFGYGVYNFSNHFAFGIYQISNTFFFSSHSLDVLSIVPSANQIYHIVVSFDGNILKIYLNGNLTASGPILVNTIPDTFFIGRDGNGLGGHFIGKIDDIGIWNRALTPQEITNLYNSQLPTQTSLCLPTITTSSPTSVGVDSVVIGGDISNDGGSSIVLRGVCYSTSPSPNMGNLRTEDGAGTGSFNTVLRGLNPSTTYYARSYAKNSNGVVVYGNEVSFTTPLPAPQPCPGTPTVTDIDGNTYNTVQIGNQCWTQSNLKVSKYRNGDNIPTGLSNSVWQNTTSGAYAIYNNDPVNDGLYGKLYNHYAVTDSRGLCPTGWHVPSDGEWNLLVKYLDPNADTLCGGCTASSIAGGSLKSTAMQPTPGGWNTPNSGATNSSGFTALPGGFGSNNGGFTNVTYVGYWWSSSVVSGSTAWVRNSYYDSSGIDRATTNRADGFSVRCLKE
jgi:uncharacterized protein (TIGR02145 family)